MCDCDGIQGGLGRLLVDGMKWPADRCEKINVGTSRLIDFTRDFL